MVYAQAREGLLCRTDELASDAGRDAPAPQLKAARTAMNRTEPPARVLHLCMSTMQYALRRVGSSQHNATQLDTARWWMRPGLRVNRSLSRFPKWLRRFPQWTHSWHLKMFSVFTISLTCPMSEVGSASR